MLVSANVHLPSAHTSDGEGSAGYSGEMRITQRVAASRISFTPTGLTNLDEAARLLAEAGHLATEDQSPSPLSPPQDPEKAQPHKARIGPIPVENG